MAAGFKKNLVPALVVITLALSVATYARNNVWTDKVTLWEDVVKKSPNWDRPHNNLGIAYYGQGRVDEAIREYQSATWLKPNDADMHNNLAKVYERQGLLDDAMREYQSVLRLDPYHAEALNRLDLLNKETGSKN